MLSLRKTSFDPPLFCAPMAGITHSAFRRLLADFSGYGALFTEMLAAKMILHENPLTSPWLKRRPQEGRSSINSSLTDTVRLPEIIERLAPLHPDGLDLKQRLFSLYGPAVKAAVPISSRMSRVSVTWSASCAATLRVHSP